MKRCPQCNRVEADDALTFCRTDGTPLVSESGGVSESAGTLKLSPAVDTTETRTLSSTDTGGSVGRSIAPTTVLENQRTAGTLELTKPKRNHRAVAAIAAIIAIAVCVVAYLFFSRGKNITAKDSIAVLPLVNTSNDPNTEYLSDGISEALINSLSELEQLRVIARSTAFRYKGKEVDPQAVGRELNVQSVLMGRVRQVGETLNIQVDLVDSATGAQLWGKEYERRISDVLAVKQEIAREITEKLRFRISGEDQRQLVRRDTTNPEAYQLYLKGRFYWNKRTEEGMKKAIEYFNQAIASDPNYALAYSGLADSYTLLGAQNATLGGSPPKDMFPKAKAAAMKAVGTDETLAEAHVSLAHITIYYSNDWVGAEREYKRAIELNPNYATAHHWYAVSLMFNGRLDEALAEIKRAQELEPLSLAINTTLGWVLWARRQHDTSAEQLRKTLEMDPNFTLAHYRLARTYAHNKMYEEAIAEFQQAGRLSGDGPLAIAGLGEAYAMSGKRSEAEKVLAQLQELSSNRFVSSYYIAVIYANLGQKDQAFVWLEKSYQEREGSYVLLKVDPGLDSLRSDPRYTNLLSRIGLTQ